LIRAIYGTANLLRSSGVLFFSSGLILEGIYGLNVTSERIKRSMIIGAAILLGLFFTFGLLIQALLSGMYY